MTEREHPPIEELIERWRVLPTTSWDDVVGHQPAISRLKDTRLVTQSGLT